MLIARMALLLAFILMTAACGASPADPNEAADGTTQPSVTTTLPPDTTTSVPPETTTTLPPPTAPEDVTVPDLIGLTLAEAETLLAGPGLEVRALPEAVAEATVVAQEPAPGVEVDPDTVVVVDVHIVPTCNPPDPLAPGPGETIIAVFFECGGDAIAPTPGVGVPRTMPDSDQAVDRIEWTLRWMLAGPTTDEQAVGIQSAFDETTAGALNTVTLTNGQLVVDFNDAIIVNNMNTSTGMVFFKAELNRNVFQHPEVDSVEYRFNGDCAAWSALFESDGCQVVSRADWDQDLAAWEQARG